jgi:hypothetical protein
MITFQILWKLIRADCGYIEDLSGADLSGADLSDADLSGADLRRANLSGADLRRANLSGANLSRADLSGADLSGADLSGADLRRADLSGADLRRANLSGANLSDANLSDANLSDAKNFFDPIQYLKKNFEMTHFGLICYKTFAENYQPNPNWKIEVGAEITEIVNPNITNDCGCGINVATLTWVRSNCDHSKVIWKCLIPIEALCTIVIPINTNGKIRCGMVKLVEVVKK